MRFFAAKKFAYFKKMVYLCSEFQRLVVPNLTDVKECDGTHSELCARGVPHTEDGEAN